MNQVPTHDQGTFCWFELATPDQPAATEFYTELFGWSHRDDPIGDDQYYTMLLHEDRDVGALYKLNEEQGVPPHWLAYVAVEDTDAAARVARDEGGDVVVEPMDVMDLGRMAVLRDPTGATFAVWQAAKHHGVGVRDETGSVCWNELATTDADAAGPFYERLFGYDSKVTEMDGADYTTFERDGAQKAGMIQMTDEWGDIPSHWMIYFAVDDCDAAAARIEELGGSVSVPPTSVPGVGRFAVVGDPQGAYFSIITLA